MSSSISSQDKKPQGGASQEALPESVSRALALFTNMPRKDKMSFLRMASGLVGAQVTFPGVPAQAGPSGTTPAPTAKAVKGKGKGKAVQQAPSNPLAGSQAKKAYDQVKKEVAAAKKAEGGVPKDLIDLLNSAKAEYFRALSESKGYEGGSTSQAP